MGRNEKKGRKPRGLELTAADRARFLRQRLLCMLSPAELADRAGLDRTTILNVEKVEGGSQRCDVVTLNRIALALGLSLRALMPDCKQLTGPRERAISFDALARVCRVVDEGVRPVIRNLTLPHEKVEDAYRSELSGRLGRDSEFDLDTFIADLSDRDHVANLLATLPSPTVTIDADVGLRSVRYSFAEREILLDDPGTLLDCSCEGTEDLGGRRDCRIHAEEAGPGAEMYARMSGGHTLIRYRGNSFYWYRESELWPPSVDSITLLETLRATGFTRKAFRSVLDLGSGTGFLGVSLGIENPHVTTLHLADWLLTPYLYGVINWRLNEGSRSHIQTQAKLGLFTEWSAERQDVYDLVVCNPPYLPVLPGWERLGWEANVVGTELLAHVISRARSLGRTTVLQFSNLALPEAAAVADQAGVNLTPLGDAKPVPLRLNVLWDHPELIDSLLRDKRGIEEKKGSRHRLWHSLQAYVVE